MPHSLNATAPPAGEGGRGGFTRSTGAAKPHDQGDEPGRHRDHHPHRTLGIAEELHQADGDAGRDDDGAGEDEADLRPPAAHRRSSRLASPTVSSSASPGSAPTTSARTWPAHGIQRTLPATNSTTVGTPSEAARCVTPESLPIHSATCPSAPASVASGASTRTCAGTPSAERSATTASASAGPA